MKTFVKVFALFALFAAFAHAAIAQNNNIPLSPANSNLQNITVNPGIVVSLATSQITGTITFSKSLGMPANFTDKVKTNMKAYKYDLVNGQLKNPQLMNNLSLTVTDVTNASSSYYKFNYVLNGNMPMGKPIIVGIGDFCVESCGGLGGIHMVFATNPQTLIAVLTSSDKVFENYNFTADKQAIPY